MNNNYKIKTILILSCFICKIIAMELPTELWVNIIARSRTPEKNNLRKCSKTLHELSCKNNMDIYVQRPLILNQRQSQYALSLCTYKNNVPAVENLYRHGAKIRYAFCGMVTCPRDIATHNKNNELSKIIDLYDCDGRDSENFGYSVLPYPLAAFFGDIDTLRKYIQSDEYNPVYEHGETDWKGSTLLAPAIRKGHINVVELLLTHPKTIQHINSGLEGRGRPIDTALINGNSAIVKILLTVPSLRIGKDHLCNHFNNCVKKRYTECVQLLLEHYNVPINELHYDNLGDFYERGHHFFNVNTTPLTIAAFNGYADTVAILLKCKEIDINASIRVRGDKNVAIPTYITPLFVAALKGHADIVQLLLSHPKIKSCTHNRLTSKRYTPLHIACEKGYVPIAKLLLAHSPQLLHMKTTDTQESPYQIAYHYKQYDMVEFLLSYQQ